jgi:3-keto-5-aminohexanoate cleavage enzyme
MSAPVIIEAAINGATRRDRTPHVPLEPVEIAADARRCFAAGAAIVHSHNAEFSVDGPRAAELYAEAWRPVLAERPDALFYPTVGIGGAIEERYAHEEILARDGLIRIGLADPGSVNLGGADEDGLPAPIDLVYVNTYRDIRHEFGLCARWHLGPSISIFEPGFLRITLAYQRAGRMPPGALVKLYFGGETGYLGGAGSGVTFGLPPTRPSLEAYLAMLEGSGLPWSVAVLGGDVIESGLARLALERGGHLRVGLEDHAGGRQPTNEALVREAVELAARIGRPVATCAETARILGLRT